MPVRLQLEGQDLEALLERVQEEYGARARIVEAEKLRTGGVGGFFAKESFAMTVELDEDAMPVAPDDPSSLFDLVDAASRSEVSTSSEAFGDVLDRLARATGDADGFVAATPPPAVATRRAKAAFSATATTATTQAPVRPRRPALPPQRDLLAPVTVPVQRAAAEATVEAPVPSLETTLQAALAATPRATPSPAPATTAKTTAKAKAKAKTRTTGKATPRTTQRATAPARATARPARTAPARPPRLTRTALTHQQLRALGLPEALLPARPGDLHRSLVTALSALPVAPEPVMRPGAVLLVIGPAAAALAAARRLSVELDLDPAAVALCAPTESLSLVPAKQRAGTARRLAVMAEGAAQRLRPLVVALDERLASVASATRHGWPTGVSAVFPDSVRWGVASATTKTSDVDRWVAQVGGVDGLWLTDVAVSADPATALGAGVPVARLDGRPASPATWASLICERMP